MKKQVFITYSWDSDDHKDWVRSLADQLLTNGVSVYLDQYDIAPGESFTHFMETSISKSDRVLVILTPSYKDKSLERKGGVGYEQQIISGEIISGMDRKKFIPLLRLGEYDEGPNCALPPHFKGISALDFRDLQNNNESFTELLRAIYEEPKFIKPDLGEKPNLMNKINANSFILELDEDLNFIRSDLFVKDIFMQISDFRKLNTPYVLSFNIKGITNELTEYFDLTKLREPSEKEIEKKIMLRQYLDDNYFLKNGSLYDYLETSINSIIDYSFNKFKYILNLDELYIAIRNSFRFFAGTNNYAKGKTKFDVINKTIKWGFSIYISNDEVNSLMSIFSTKDKGMLVIFAGLLTSDLSHTTLVENIIPKGCYQFILESFRKEIPKENEADYFQVGNLQIGIG